MNSVDNLPLSNKIVLINNENCSEQTLTLLIFFIIAVQQGMMSYLCVTQNKNHITKLTMNCQKLCNLGVLGEWTVRFFIYSNF